MIIELRMIHPTRGIIRSPLLEALDTNAATCQYVLQVKWGYDETVEVKGLWKLLMSTIKTAVNQSGITVMPDSYGQKLEGTDRQLLTMLECFNPDKNTWSKGARKWYKKLSHSTYSLQQGKIISIASTETIVLRSFQQFDKQTHGDLEEVDERLSQFKSRAKLLLEEIDLQWQVLSRSLIGSTEDDKMLSYYQQKLAATGKQIQGCKSKLQSARYIEWLCVLPHIVKTLQQVEHYLQSLYIGRYTFDLGIYKGFSSATSELLNNFKTYSKPLELRTPVTDTHVQQQLPKKLVKQPSVEELGKSGLYKTELDESPKEVSGNNNTSDEVKELNL